MVVQADQDMPAAGTLKGLVKTGQLGSGEAAALGTRLMGTEQDYRPGPNRKKIRGTDVSGIQDTPHQTGIVVVPCEAVYRQFNPAQEVGQFFIHLQGGIAGKITREQGKIKLSMTIYRVNDFQQGVGRVHAGQQFIGVGRDMRIRQLGQVDFSWILPLNFNMV